MPTVAAIAGIALTSALGIWQLGRGNEKAAQVERLSSGQSGPVIAVSAVEINASDVAWKRVEADGRFAAEYTLFIDNRILHGMVGYHVITPLKIENGDRYVLVN
ncbi:MAG: SURF1 family protein, partial [Betaproteobacteria bacterium]|nr:SURF1 family protein [Betaproteobacteria bacterium]